MSDEGRFVGRRVELRVVGAALGRGDPVLLLGDAGVGKSRLAREVVADLSRHGTWCLTASCLPMSTPLPLLPVVDLLREASTVAGGQRFDAALAVCPAYVREDVARILPEMGGTVRLRRVQPWMLSRLYAALAQLLTALAAASPLLLVVEDLHWSDPVTRDFLTYLLAHRTRRGAGLLLTARGDQPTAQDDWLWQTSVSAGIARVLVPPLSREEVAALVTAARGAAAPDLVEELWLRAEGNAFFTEQLLAADPTGTRAVLADELAQLLRSRLAAASDDGRAVVELLAVAGRPLRHDELARGRGTTEPEMQRCLRGLARARLIRSAQGGVATRHALLGEAVVDGLLPSDRASLHALVATLLAQRQDPSLAAEVARHWQQARQPEEERDARVAEAEQAERMGALAEAGVAWDRAFELAQRTGRTADALTAGEIALRGVAAWEAAGQSPDAEALAFRALAATGHTAASRAALQARYAMLRAVRDRSRGLVELSAAADALTAVEPSPDLVETHHRLYHLELGRGNGMEALEHLRLAVQTGEALPPNGEHARALASQAYERMRGGDLEGGRAALDRARALTPGHDVASHAGLAHLQVYALLQLSRLAEAEQVGREALELVRTHGLLASFSGTMLLVNVVAVLVAAGRVEAAGALVDPLTDGPVTADGRVLHGFRSWVDVHRGHLAEAAGRQQALQDLVVDPGPETATEFARMRAELAFWSGDLDRAARVVDEVLPGLPGRAEPLVSAGLLVSSMRTCAELAEVAASRHDPAGAVEAEARAAALEAEAARCGPEVLVEHPFFAIMAPLGLEWEAERLRLRQRDSEEDWAAVRQRWLAVGWPHRAGYASWRLAHVALRRGDRAHASEALGTAWRLADQHVPLRSRIATLARFARIALPGEDPPRPVDAPPAATVHPWGLTTRELDVLGLLTEGLTNAEIGARLYMSPKTASVHVTAILRKLGAANRVHAATMAERAGLVRAD